MTESNTPQGPDPVHESLGKEMDETLQLKKDQNEPRSDVAKDDNTDDKKEEEYPGMWQLALISLAMGFAIFISGLDNTIVGTATPTITNDFKTLSDIGWYGSSYQLTTCATQFLYAKFYEQFRVKWVFVAAVCVLELGSIISAAAPTSTVFIVGRAIAGCGASGIITGTLIIVAHSVPLRWRPIFNGMVGGIECIAIIIAPLIGGVLATNSTWRWCFWLNLPVGAFTVAVIIFCFTNPKGQTVSDEPLGTKIKQLNLGNLALFVGSSVCLLLALQWGGTIYPWSDGRVIALLVVSAAAFGAFVAVEATMKDRATIPLRIVAERTVALCLVYAFCTAAALVVLDFFLPIWFQAIRGVSAAESGVMLLPSIIGLSIASISAGFIVSFVGYYTPLMLFGSVLMALGFGFTTAFNVDTSNASWIGWQVAVGVGGGLVFSQPFTAVQTAVAEADIPVGMSAVVFANTLGGALSISIAQNIFANLLRNRLAAIPGVDSEALLSKGATEILTGSSPAQRQEILLGYNYAATSTFWISVGTVCLGAVAALGMKWNSVKAEEKANDKDEQKTTEEGSSSKSSVRNAEKSEQASNPGE